MNVLFILFAAQARVIGCEDVRWKAEFNRDMAIEAPEVTATLTCTAERVIIDCDDSKRRSPRRTLATRNRPGGTRANAGQRRRGALSAARSRAVARGT